MTAVRTIFLTAIVATIALTAACDRPFVEQTEPEIELVVPDTNSVVASARIEVRVRASSFRPIERVEIENEILEFDPFEDVWVGVIDLRPGENRITIRAFDTEDVEGSRDVVLVFVTPRIVFGPSGELTPRGNHATIVTGQGGILVNGGTSEIDGPATDDSFIAPISNGLFQRTQSGLQAARAGHTLISTPDNRVLVLGGATVGTVTSVGQLVETVELFDPEASGYRVVPFVGDPIRRSDHTASARMTSEGFKIDLFGGVGDVEYRPESRLGIRDDIRTFLFENDTLYALGPGVGGFLGVSAMTGHMQTSLTGRTDQEPDHFLFSGTFFGDSFTESASFTVDFADPLGLLPVETGVTLAPRTQHAAAHVGQSLIAVFGGAEGPSEMVIGSIEMYSHRARRFLSVPLQGSPLFRTRHTATKLPDNRILLLGGFSASGNSLSLVEYFVFNAL